MRFTCPAAHPVDGDDVLHAELAGGVQELGVLGAAAAGLAHDVAEAGEGLRQGLTLCQLIVGLHGLRSRAAGLSSCARALTSYAGCLASAWYVLACVTLRC